VEENFAVIGSGGCGKLSRDQTIIHSHSSFQTLTLPAAEIPMASFIHREFPSSTEFMIKGFGSVGLKSLCPAKARSSASATPKQKGDCRKVTSMETKSRHAFITLSRLSF
jgi:hypothetical protein